MTKILVEKAGVQKLVKPKYLENSLSQGWREVAAAPKNKPAVKVRATAAVEEAPQEEEKPEIDEEGEA